MKDEDIDLDWDEEPRTTTLTVDDLYKIESLLESVDALKPEIVKKILAEAGVKKKDFEELINKIVDEVKRMERTL